MKRRRILGVCALFVWLALLPSGPGGVLAAQGGALLREALRDPLSILSDRSPGLRGAGALVQSKPGMAVRPTERVLSPVRDRPGTPIPVDLNNLPNRVMDVIAPASAPQPGSPGAYIIPPPQSGGGGIGSGSGSGTIGSGGGGGTELSIPAPPPPPVISAVPEPATWIMMIAGVALIGLQLRRRRAAEVSAAA